MLAEMLDVELFNSLAAGILLLGISMCLGDVFFLYVIRKAFPDGVKSFPKDDKQSQKMYNEAVTHKIRKAGIKLIVLGFTFLAILQAFF